MKILAVFPDLHDENPGGVQVSGQLAWDALQREADAHAIFANNLFQLIAKARATDFQPELILFWHVDLLRAVPFMRTKGKRVVFFHGIEVWKPHSWFMRTLLRQTHVLANSQYTLDRAASFIPQLRNINTLVVHLGLGTPREVTQPMQNIRAAIMIGRLDRGERYKGHHEVIRAWPQVLRDVPNAQLWIVGEGSMRSELETLATNVGVDAVVRFYGRIADNEKEMLLNAARCLVLPSRAEGFGLVYVEAMRAGRPSLVGLDAGREVVNPPEAGVSVDPGNEMALAAAIVRLMSDDAQWQRQSLAARARYERTFTAAHFQQRLIDALQRTH